MTTSVRPLHVVVLMALLAAGLRLPPPARSQVDHNVVVLAPDFRDGEAPGEISHYRFVGEHRFSGTGMSTAFVGDTDCDGFDEVLIGAPHVIGDGQDWRSYDEPGAVYLVSAADLETADAADGLADRVIDLAVIPRQPRSWKLVGDDAYNIGSRAAATGDADGDGCSDFLVGTRRYGYFQGAAYLVTATELSSADSSDGKPDGVVDLSRVSVVLAGEHNLSNAGHSLTFVDDVNGDRRPELLIGAWSYNESGASRGASQGAAYLLSSAALASADGWDGALDGRISLSSVSAQPDSWKFVGESPAGDHPGSRAGRFVSSGDFDADGRADLVISAVQYGESPRERWFRRGAVYLVAAADLSALDASDGASDGVVRLGNVSGGAGSWKLVGDETIQLAGWGVEAAGDVDGDGVNELVVPGTVDRFDHNVAHIVSVADLPLADVADGAADGVVSLGHVISQPRSFELRTETTQTAYFLSVSARDDLDGDGLADIVVADGTVGRLENGRDNENGAVYLISGADLPGADAADGVADRRIDLGRVASQGSSWKLIGEPGDALGNGEIDTGDVDGDGALDVVIGSDRLGPGHVVIVSSAYFAAADARDGEADGEIHLEALPVRGDGTPGPAPVIRVTQFDDNVVIMQVSGALKTAELDFQRLSRSFFEYYDDIFDYLIFISNLPSPLHSLRYTYSGIHYNVSNSVAGTGKPLYGPAGKLNAMIHLVARDALLDGPALHEIMHSWANYAVPSVDRIHWGFSSANGQLGGFDMANLVDLGNGRYSAGEFGTNANFGNSVPYSPIELYFAGLIPPQEVPDLWVAKDGRWLGRDDEGNPTFGASQVETWSVDRIIAEHGMRAPNWMDSQKQFRAAVILLVDDQFRATASTLRELSAAIETFTRAGDDGDGSSYNFWEATGGRATLGMADLGENGAPIVSGGGFTDDPVVAGDTVVRTVHFTELRERIDALRVREGLQRYPWTDRRLVSGATAVRRVHLLELRMALDRVYDAAGRSRPSYTDALLADDAPVRATHLNELRRAVVALE